MVEKAKIIQQSKKAAVAEKGTLRRSSRAEASTKKSYCEDEVQLIVIIFIIIKAHLHNTAQKNEWQIKTYFL